MPPEVTLARSSRRTIRHAGAEYDLLVAWPAQPPPPEGYPVAYLLDAHVAFATMVESERARSRRADATGVPPTVVAGLTLTGPQDRERRTWDFTREGLVPPAGEPWAGPTPATGGGGVMHELLASVVIPTVEDAFPVDSERRLLFGHSLSGLFVLDELLDGGDLFRAYAAASPSIWWDPDGLAARATQRAGRPPDGSVHVLLTAGEYEEVLAPWQAGVPGAAGILARRQRRRMVGRVLDMGQRLAPLARQDGSVRALVYPGEDHASVVTLTVNDALRIWSPRSRT